MNFRIGLLELMVAATVSAGLVWLLEWQQPAGAALGVIVVPLVALATSLRVSAREDRLWQPVRGLCDCGHQMSMHCHGDCSGPCAVPNCSCLGQR